MRFTSPDPSAESFNPEDPQSWNRYSYVENNPLKFADPLGLNTVTTTTTTSTYTLTYQDQSGNVVYQTETQVTETTTTETDNNGNQVSSSTTITSSTRNTGAGSHNFTQNQLNTISNTVTDIYTYTPSGRDPKLGVAVGAKESQLGAYAGPYLGPQPPSVNPFQLSGSSTYRPTANVDSNIQIALTKILFPDVSRFGLRGGLEHYNGTRTRGQYATDVMRNYNEINNTQQTRVNTTTQQKP